MDIFSKRTRDALAAAKARGQCLGNPNLADARLAGVATLKAQADQVAANILPLNREIQKAGVTSLRGIADALNARGVQTPRGGQWYAASVRNILARG